MLFIFSLLHASSPFVEVPVVEKLYEGQAKKKHTHTHTHTQDESKEGVWMIIHA